MGILQGDSPTPGPAMYWVSSFICSIQFYQEDDKKIIISHNSVCPVSEKSELKNKK